MKYHKKKKVEIFVCLASVMLLISCFNPDDYKNPDSAKIITLLSIDTTAIADGANAVPVKVRISADAANNKRKVVFKTSLGSFKGGAGDSIVVTAGENFMAMANLVSVNTGLATVYAKILTVKTKSQMKVTFTKAFPETVKVSVDSFQIKNTFKSEITITASLARGNGGIPSTGTPVTFRVQDQAGNDVGTFLNNTNISTSGSDGKTKIRYSAGPTTYQGYLTITATIVKSDGVTTSATTRIFVTN
jgi:hypothetical protein